ncbi:RNA-binding protein [Chloropicon primus]|uniref:RNA-binding protein n=1 Tax=Chloropicon primus TaxID=1764295 RepID=A0A5B8MX66_9CHLO|nr:RNA-binding protein [Chloropicon primus]|mmetsp:Transcript_13851/g.39057  ORF Transcript_13851/g.39057 Transcript_13851/m.39057 type:complete len:507 (-) Transcript_13851:2222-3742(-)|eukprot:QDZ24124.1 RNA-binding protein [Chloropicon primus]
MVGLWPANGYIKCSAFCRGFANTTSLANTSARVSRGFSSLTGEVKVKPLRPARAAAWKGDHRIAGGTRAAREWRALAPRGFASEARAVGGLVPTWSWLRGLGGKGLGGYCLGQGLRGKSTAFVDEEGVGVESLKAESARGAEANSSNNRRIFVTNLSYGATEDDLKEFLEREGQLESVRIKYTLVDGARQSRGFATAVFSRAEDAWSAIANLNDATFQGRKIKVREDNFSKLDKKSVAHKNVEKKVFVDFLDPSLLWQDVKEHFQQTGNVFFVHLLWDQTRMHRQAVVEFGSPEEAQDAIEELNQSILRGAAMKVRAYHSSDMQEKEPLSPTVFVNYIHPEIELEDLNNHFLQVVPNIEFSKIFFHKTDDYQQAKVTLSSTAMAKMAIEKIDRSLLYGKAIRCRAFLDNNNNSSRYLQGVWRERRVSKGPQAPRCQIENLNPRAGWQEVKDHLRPAGTVVHVNVTWAEDGGKRATAEVGSEEDLSKIISELNGTVLLGDKIKVSRL